MNKSVTSREELIRAAMDIAGTEGVHKVSIRSIAKKCSISVGVMYNYFPTKADLTFAVVESFWNHVIDTLEGWELEDACFTSYVAKLYDLLDACLTGFQREWLIQMETMAPEEKKRGKEMETAYFKRLKKRLLLTLKQDTSIAEELWSKDYPQDIFLEFVFGHLIGMLRMGQKNCSFFIKTLEKILY